MKIHRYLLAAASALAIAATLGSCTTETGPAVVKSARVTVFHANPGFTSPVVFTADSVTLGANVAYGATDAGTAKGSPGTTVNVKGTDGTQLASSSVTVDSTTDTWTLFCGDATDRDAFTASSAMIFPVSGEVAIRFINASKNAGSVSLKVNSLTGASLAGTTAYKGASNYTTNSAASITALFASDGSATPVAALTGLSLSSLKRYTVVLYGSKTATTGTYQPKLAIFQEQ